MDESDMNYNTQPGKYSYPCCILNIDITIFVINSYNTSCVVNKEFNLFTTGDIAVLAFQSRKIIKIHLDT